LRTGEPVIEQIAILTVHALIIGLTACWIVLLLYGITGVMRNLFDKPRFRLRTMLLAVALLQAVLATVIWLQKESGPFGLLPVWLAGLSMVAWLVWVSFEEFLQLSTSQRWQRVMKAKRVHLPAATYATRGKRRNPVEPPPIVNSGQCKGGN
jgi:hypothetical protein